MEYDQYWNAAEKFTVKGVGFASQYSTVGYNGLQESREKVRTGVQELMAIISSIDSSMQEVTDKQEVQSKAQEALEQLTTNSEETTNA